MKDMHCPHCGTHDLRVIGKRNALYPLGCFYFLGFPFALMHQLQSPIDFECNTCGKRFANRTRTAKVCTILVIVFWLVSLGVYLSMAFR